jgi:PKD repeat protein
MTQTLELEGGDYNVTWIANNNQGCPSEEMKASLQPASNLEVTAVTTPMECGDMNSAAIELHVSGGAGEVSVMWTHGAQGTTLENLTHGNYEALLVDDNGCSERIEVEIDESPTVVANFEVPAAGLTDSEQNSALFNFTNTSEGLITGNTWYFGDTDTPSYDYHGTHTFTEAGIYDVFLNVWNDRCSHTVRKTVVVEFDDQHGTQNDLPEQSTNIVEGRLDDIKAPATTASGWKMDLGAAAEGMTLYAFDLNGRQLCMPAQADANGQISVENSNWPKLVYLRLVHEPTNSVRVWKMER